MSGFLKYLAANTLVGGWDNYWRNARNYYLYNEANRGYWRWIAWDYDNCMGHNFLHHEGYSITGDSIHYEAYPNLVLIHRVLFVPEWRREYHATLRRFIRDEFNPQKLYPRIDRLAKQLLVYISFCKIT